MPLDPDIAAIVELMGAMELPPMSEVTPEMARQMFDSTPGPPPDSVTEVTDRTLAGPSGPVAVRTYRPSEEASLPLVAFFHGGGWVTSSVEGHDSMARRIAVNSGALVVSVDYRLAPEDPFPAAADDCWAATAWLAEKAGAWGGDPDRLAVCGDSAGGNLAASVALRAREHGLVLALQALIYPCIDDRQGDYASMIDNGSGLFLEAETMKWFWDHYVPAASRDDPLAVPARAESLEGVAPALVQVAEYDPLRDEGTAYADRLREAGVATEFICYPGVVHGFASMWHVSSRAEAAHHDLAAALQRAFS